MFVIRTIHRNIFRHWKKSSLSILLTFMIILFLLLYMQNIEGNEAQLIMLGKTIPVTTRICNIDGSQDVGLQIDFKRIQEICKTGLIKDEIITIQNFADLESRTYEVQSHRPEFSFIGTNALSAFSAFSPKDVTYIENYDESFLEGVEAVCIVRDKFMKEQKINLGSEVELTVYAPEYDKSGSYTFTFQRIKTIKLKVIGSFHTKINTASDELPDIISPIGFAEKIYEGTNVTPYASSARFSLEDPFRINEYKSEMKKIGFSSIDIQAAYSRIGQALTMNDETFIMSATHLTESLNLLKSLAPLIFIIVALIGFIASYLLMQSRRNEFAIMRSLGTSKKKCFQIIFLESMLVVLLGGLLGAIVSSIIVNLAIMMMGLILAIFVICYMLGTAVALYLLNRFSVMAILTKTD